MVRAAKEQDLPHILTIYNVARRYMRAHGNTAQWVNGYLLLFRYCPCPDR